MIVLLALTTFILGVSILAAARLRNESTHPTR